MNINEQRLLELADAMGEMGLLLRDVRYREKDSKIFNFAIHISIHMGAGKAWVLNLLKYAKDPKASTLETGFAAPAEDFLTVDKGVIKYEGVEFNWAKSALPLRIKFMANFMNQVFQEIDDAVEGNIYGTEVLPRKAQLSADNVFFHMHEAMIALEYIRDILSLHKPNGKSPLANMIDGTVAGTPPKEQENEAGN